LTHWRSVSAMAPPPPRPALSSAATAPDSAAPTLLRPGHLQRAHQQQLLAAEHTSFPPEVGIRAPLPA
jgi:hypothetical protein